MRGLLLLPLPLLLLLLGTILAPASARAEDAAARWQTAQELFRAGDYEHALTEFAAGYHASGRPAFLFNMAECARLMQARRQAHRLYLAFLRTGAAGRERSVALERCRSLGLGSCAPARGAARRPVTRDVVEAAVPEQPEPAQRSAEPAPPPEDDDNELPAGLERGGRPATPAPPPLVRDTTPSERGPLPLVATARHPAPRAAQRGTPFYRHWVFWTVVGAAVTAGAVTAGVVVAGRGHADAPVLDFRR